MSDGDDKVFGDILGFLLKAGTVALRAHVGVQLWGWFAPAGFPALVWWDLFLLQLFLPVLTSSMPSRDVSLLPKRNQLEVGAVNLVSVLMYWLGGFVLHFLLTN